MSDLPPSLSLAAIPTATARGSASAQATPLPEPKAQQMTNAYYSAFGDNHSRAVHAKGILFEGTFTPDPAARSITRAKLFALSTAARCWALFPISRVFRPFPTTSETQPRADWL